jgi:chromosomal replication initiation ATPase DnaA
VTIWDEILEHLRTKLPEEDFRHWFGATSYASDSGDQVTVWVPTESIRRHITREFQAELDRALAAIGRQGTNVRMVVGGMEEDEDEDSLS